jgi:hypothetical protein
MDEIKEKASIASKKYYLKNKEKIKERMKNYYNSNKEKIISSWKNIYYVNNKQKIQKQRKINKLYKNGLITDKETAIKENCCVKIERNITVTF